MSDPRLPRRAGAIAALVILLCVLIIGSSSVPVNSSDRSGSVVAPANINARRLSTESAMRASLSQQAGTVQFSAASYTVGEGDERVTLVVTRLGDVSGAATVDYSTVGDATITPCADLRGIASERCDYSTSLDTLAFVAGETSKTFTIPIIDDARVEGAESFTVRLSNPTNATLGAQPTATVNLDDNDVTPALANPADDISFFVRQQYLDFLSREPEPAGFQDWFNLL